MGAREGPRRRDVVASLLVLILWVVPITEGAFNAAPGSGWPVVIRDFGSMLRRLG